MSQDGNRHPLLILSENPLDGIWTHLSAFESEKLATKLIQERASQANVSVEEELLKRKATALAYCIRNARENLLSTAALSLTPRTIANYYGCLWLASALMVADPKSEIDLERLEKFTKFGHGLGNIVADDRQFPDNEYVYVNESGFFPQFLHWLGLNNHEVRDLSLQRRPKSIADVPSEDQKKLISLADLFARVPELSDAYENVTGRPTLCFRVYSAISMNRDEDSEDRKKASSSVMKRTRAYTWLALGSSDVALDAHLREHGPPLEDLEIRDNDGDRSWTGRLPHPVGAPWDQHLPTHRSVMAPTCWIKPVLSRIDDPFALQLMLLYELSILARYRPAIWREVLEGSFDHYRTLILGNNAVVARVIPEWVLRRIVGRRRVHVTTPGSYDAPL
jgi:hypothetical protein